MRTSVPSSLLRSAVALRAMSRRPRIIRTASLIAFGSRSGPKMNNASSRRAPISHTLRFANIPASLFCAKPTQTWSHTAGMDRRSFGVRDQRHVGCLRVGAVPIDHRNHRARRVTPDESDEVGGLEDRVVVDL